jgi:hypothetical protein
MLWKETFHLEMRKHGGELNQEAVGRNWSLPSCRGCLSVHVLLIRIQVPHSKALIGNFNPLYLKIT